MPVHDISVRLLLVTDDLEAINFLTHILQRLAITVEICPDMQAAARKLCRAKFEAVIIDFCDRKAASELLQSVTESTAHKACVRFALLPPVPASERIPEWRVHFFIRRPLSSVEIIRIFKAAYPLMVRERRRCFRCDLQIPVTVQRVSGSSVAATSANISEGGIAITTAAGLSVGERVRLVIQLPGTPNPLSLGAEVCWAKDDRCGLQFASVPSNVQLSLQSWLSDQLDASLQEVSQPGHVARV